MSLKQYKESGAIQCSLCERICESIVLADSYGWDWFTGYLPERFVACKKCQIGQAELVGLRQKQSKVVVPLPRKFNYKNFKSRIILP